nr:hypothetical protein [Erythrotrichia foliiformis]
MIHSFFPISITSFLLLKHKTQKIIYTESSYILKFVTSIAIVAIYKPMTIQSLIFVIFFLLFIYRKLYSRQYISYKKISNNFIIIKFLFLISMFILEKNKTSYENINRTLLLAEPNSLVMSSEIYSKSTSKKIYLLISNITKSCLTSIYKIEVISLISIIASNILLISIQPRNLLHLLQRTKLTSSIKSEINLIFVFSSQIYFLISDQVIKVIHALKIRSSNHTIKTLIENKKIIEFFIFYMLRKKYSLRHDIMTSAQLHSNNFKKADYIELSITPIVSYSNTILSILLILISCFLAFI